MNCAATYTRMIAKNSIVSKCLSPKNMELAAKEPHVSRLGSTVAFRQYSNPGLSTAIASPPVLWAECCPHERARSRTPEH